MKDTKILVPQTEQRFTETVAEILKSAGFTTEAQPKAGQALPMEKTGHAYCAEIKYSTTRAFSDTNAVSIYIRLEALEQTDGLIPLVVVGGEVSPSLREELRVANRRTEVVDIRNLLYMAAKKRELYDELAALLPYPISGLTPVPPSFLTDSTLPRSPSGSDTRPAAPSDPIRKQKESDSYELCRELSQWKGGKGTRQSIEYEGLCTRVLKQLFGHDDLSLWESQAKSNDDLYRFDLICKIKRDNQKDFWEMAEHHFHSKYIIFEFKNYSGKVTQMEITTTARYLYTKALRSVAIIVSPNGFSEHAEKAARGALREDGKLILSLTNADLIEMLRNKNTKDPAEFLSEKLDILLINLEK